MHGWMGRTFSGRCHLRLVILKGFDPFRISFQRFFCIFSTFQFSAYSPSHWGNQLKGSTHCQFGGEWWRLRHEFRTTEFISDLSLELGETAPNDEGEDEFALLDYKMNFCWFTFKCDRMTFLTSFWLYTARGARQSFCQSKICQSKFEGRIRIAFQGCDHSNFHIWHHPSKPVSFRLRPRRPKSLWWRTGMGLRVVRARLFLHGKLILIFYHEETSHS